MTIQDTHVLINTIKHQSVSLIPEGYQLTLKITRKHNLCERSTSLDKAQSIKDLTCKFFNKHQSEITAKTRKPEIVLIRKMICRMLREHTSLNLKQVGSFVSYDHSDVIKAVRSLDDWLYGDETLRATADELNKLIITTIKN